MLDYHAIKRDIKTELLARCQPDLLQADPLAWAWSARALSSGGTLTNPFLASLIELARKWLSNKETWGSSVDMAAISMLCNQMIALGDNCCDDDIETILVSITEQRQKGISKFSRLNDPFYVYGLSVGTRDFLSNDDLKWLRQHCENNIQTTNLRRGLIFAASAVELGGTPATFAIVATDIQIHDILAALWAVERYPSLIHQDQRQAVWDAYESIQDGINWTESTMNSGAVYTASIIDIAMFYEALSGRTSEVDFITLFNNFPWHPMVKSSAESLFHKGEYVNAVFEAAKMFVDEVKVKSGHPTGSDGRPLDGANLMTKVFAPNSAILKFNGLTSVADRDEQRGLCLIAEGIVAAVRNPKGHVPKANITLSPEEALEQLAIINHLMRRLDTAQL